METLPCFEISSFCIAGNKRKLSNQLHFELALTKLINWNLLESSLTISYTYMTTPFCEIGMFEIEDISLGLPSLIAKLAFKSGSSKHGKTRLAPMA